MNAEANSAASQPTSGLPGLLRRNPEALLLIGAGLALIAGSARRTGAGRTAPSEPYAARSLEAAGSLARTAAERRSAVPDHVPDGGALVQTAFAPFEDLSALALVESPLALAGLGLAAGAALGAALPGDPAENAIFGEPREWASRFALRKLNDQLRKLRAARAAATEKLKEEAEARSLDPEGLKDLAQKVAQAAKEGALREPEEQFGAAERGSRSPKPAASGASE